MLRNFLFSLFVLISISMQVAAKDLTHRLGVGFKNNTSLDLPSLAAIYYPSSNMGFTGGLGIDTKSGYSSFQIMGGLRYIIYPESNMNFYSGGQFAILSYDSPSDGKKNGAELAGIFGVEFFLSGLENLGFTFEAGLALATTGSSRLRTLGQDPFRAGLIFYF